jgi:mRNA-degrading endonuclease RelE of RelBE toxin-antitoxin system
VSSTNYEVRLGLDATKAYESLPAKTRTAVRSALIRLAASIPKGERGGKRVKTIKGARDSFHRLRVGEYRIMYDVIHEDRVVLVLGIVNRADLDRWLRGK